VAYLPPGLGEAELVAAAADRGVAVHGLAPYRLSTPGRPGLVFGYATLEEPAIRRGVALLAGAATAARPG
jgi:GntR family transcriptional regulator/MocR family aminotransferase